MPIVKEDQRTFRRGRSTAVGGLAVQVVLAAATAITAAWSRDAALAAATWHMLGGLPIWIVLVLWYGQREVECREALIAERIADRDAASALLFGEHSDELQHARQRLTTIARRGLPTVSLLVSVYLLSAGGLLLQRGQELWLGGGDAPSARPLAHPVGLLFAEGGITFLAFVAGRWISGCCRVPAWQLLRGGASYLMSCFVIAGLVTVAAAVTACTGDRRLFDLLAAVIPLVMLLVGGEILIASLFELYRPRTSGELPRPAFDSRLLGLLTAPESLGEVVGDLIRYQFGVDVSGSWFFRLLGRSLAPLALLSGGVLAALSCLVVIGPDEEGVVLRFGAITGRALPAGMHFKLPWPVETATTFPTRRVLQLSVSSSLAGESGDGEDALWATGDDRLAHIGREYYPVPLSTAAAGGGLAVVDAEVVVQYRVGDLLAFLARAPQAEVFLGAVAQREAARYFAGHQLDFLLSRGRALAGPDLAAAIQARIDPLRLGLTVVDAGVTSIQPPGAAVARAFHRQVAARQESETLVEQSRRDAAATLARVAGSESLGRRLDAAILATDTDRTAAAETEIDSLLLAARGEAAERIHAARGDRWSRAGSEQAARERFAGELLAYQRAPRYYRAARFFEVLAAGLAERRKFIVTGDADGLPILRMDFADPASALDTLLNE